MDHESAIKYHYYTMLIALIRLTRKKHQIPMLLCKDFPSRTFSMNARFARKIEKA